MDALRKTKSGVCGRAHKRQRTAATRHGGSDLSASGDNDDSETQSEDSSYEFGEWWLKLDEAMLQGSCTNADVEHLLGIIWRARGLLRQIPSDPMQTCARLQCDLLALLRCCAVPSVVVKSTSQAVTDCAPQHVQHHARLQRRSMSDLRG